MIGVIIEKGASDWQIFQQENGYAKVTLEGHYVRNHDPEKEEGYAKVPNVFVMVSKEENGEPVIWWRKCEISGEHWRTELDIPAGGPYTIHTSLGEGEADRWSEWDTRGDIIQHVGVGDLYVIAGQSNSSGYGKDFITDPPELGVHVYKNNGRWTLAAHPLQDSTGADGKPNLDTSNTGHSLYLSFAKYLKHDLGYPIGLIQTSQGGSPLSAWNPGQDGRLYRNMIQCIKECGGKIAACIWYQGCNETNFAHDAETYAERFLAMRQKMFEDLGYDNIPFVVVQIACCNDPASAGADGIWGTVREQIRELNRGHRNLYVIPASDLSYSDHIHISAASNMRLGERAAKVLLHHVFGKTYMCDAPDIKYAKRKGADTVEVAFDNVYERLEAQIDGKNLAIKAEDSDGIVNVREYKIEDRNKIILRFERKPGPGAVLNCGATKNTRDIIPFDYATHLPVLLFYGVKIED